jgi:hypothetical protein
MMNGTCGLEELSELYIALISDADLGNHRNMMNTLAEYYSELNQVFEIPSSIAQPSAAPQNNQ